MAAGDCNESVQRRAAAADSNGGWRKTLGGGGSTELMFMLEHPILEVAGMMVAVAGVGGGSGGRRWAAGGRGHNGQVGWQRHRNHLYALILNSRGGGKGKIVMFAEHHALWIITPMIIKHSGSRKSALLQDIFLRVMPSTSKVLGKA
jgi:hypothetical protein